MNRVTARILITGTGRSGTTFMVQLMHTLGFDCGLERLPDGSWHDKTGLGSGYWEGFDAGLEFNIMDAIKKGYVNKLPHVVKKPRAVLQFEEIVQSGLFPIQHVIVPIRDLEDVVESRKIFVRRAKAKGKRQVAKKVTWQPGVDGTAADMFHMLHSLAYHEIPHTLVHFPRVIFEPDYAFRRMQAVIGDLTFDDFKAAHASVADPSKVHR